ncbi:MAG: Mur ligase [Gemmatimonadales bacterium]|nr:MAG: Mur ligase [Gemmatimonadales bacterium]
MSGASTEPTPGTPLPPLFTDSRRLFGPTPWLDGPGAVLDVPAPHGHDPTLLEAWAARVDTMRAVLGWTAAAPGALARHRHARGAILGIPAPPHLLLAATSLAEWALQAAAEDLGLAFDPASLEPDALPLDEAAALADLRARAEAEADAPPDDHSFETSPHIAVALVTGSNGKTTTTRLLAAMLGAHGHTVGFTSTDGIQVGDVRVETGDWSGPQGAARVLGEPAVTAAVLETARGGLLRRGLVVDRADVAVITNVSEDHFGEYGVDTLADLARVKGLVARALRPGGVLVLNGDDPLLSPDGPDDPSVPPCARPCRDGVRVLRFSLARPWPGWLPPPEEIPITAGGRARYNAANALAAALAARAMGIPESEIVRTLRRFGTRPEDNPGRMVREEVGGVTLLFDYAHNPAGLGALLEVARAGSPAGAQGSGGRLLLLLGQAGDRGDDAIRELARAAWSACPDRIILREVTGYVRGRAPGEVPGILARELERLGFGTDQVHTRLDEHEAVRDALAWARPGDLLVLPIHGLAARKRLLELVAELRQAGWQAGDLLPGQQRPAT